MSNNVDDIKAKYAEERKQLLARQKAEIAKFTKSERKHENRRKVIIGSALLKTVNGKSKNVIEFLRAQLMTLAEKDKALYPELFAPITPPAETKSS